MKTFPSLRVALASLLVLPSVMAVAQDLSLDQALSGGKYPATLKPADLPDDYKAVKLGTTANLGGVEMMNSMLPLMLMGTPSVGSRASLLKVIDLSWTKGETTTIDGKSFLVTYKLDYGYADLISSSAALLGATGQSDTSVNQPTKADLKLVLVRSDVIGTISPAPEINKAALLEALGSRPKTIFDQAQSSAKETSSLSNLKQIALASIMYANDYDDLLPYVQSTKSMQWVTTPYLKNNSVWTNPNPAGGQYLLNMSLAGVNLSGIDKPAETILFYESTPWEDGRRGVAYADGHAKRLTADEWTRAQATLHLKLTRKGKPLPANYGLKELAALPKSP